jgi:hypothetical protein
LMYFMIFSPLFVFFSYNYIIIGILLTQPPRTVYSKLNDSLMEYNGTVYSKCERDSYTVGKRKLEVRPRRDREETSETLV